MTIDEATEKCNTLADINFKIWWASPSEKKILRQKYSDLWNEVIAAGFKIKHGKKFDDVRGCTVPWHKPIVNKNANMTAIVDNRSPAGAQIHGDCTTRCISFCTGENYDDVKAEQLKTAINGKWRRMSNWSKLLLKRGFSRIDLKRRITRKTFIKAMATSHINTGIVAARSSGHVAAIDLAKKQVLDLWDSSGGRITTLFVPTAQLDAYVSALHYCNAL